MADACKAWDYLETEPAADAPISDNPSGMYCPACRLCDAYHCGDVEYCGGMRLMKPRPSTIPEGST